MKLGLAVLFGLLALASESLVSVLLAILAGWLLGAHHELASRLRRLELARAPAAAQKQAAPVATRSDAQAPAGLEPDADPHSRRPDVAAGAAAGSADAGAANDAGGPPTMAAPAGSPPPIPPQPQRPSREPRPQSAPASGLESGWGERLLDLLFGGNLPVKLGVLVLFAGVAAALRYAAEQGWLSLPIGWRFLGIAAVALSGLGFGLAQRDRRPGFALALQGGAIGILLMCVFGAFRLYALLPAGLALVLVVVIVALGAVLAVWQNASALAVLGFLGGYLGPVLISSGSGDQIALFSYYAALNAALFGIAWWRHWHALNLIGFGFTFGVGSLWGLRAYDSGDYLSSQLFLLLFWAFYLGIVMLGALRRGLAASHSVQASLTFALPLWAFALQAGLLDGERMQLAGAALVAAAVYAALSAQLLRRGHTRLQGESFAWVAVGFATVAVPLAFSAQQTAAIWALQGVGALWLGLRQQRRASQVLGWLLQLAAGCSLTLSALLAVDEGRWSNPETVLGLRISLGLLALAGFAASFVHERLRPMRAPVWLLFGLGSFWLSMVWLHVLDAPPLALHAVAAGVLTCVVFAALAGVLRGLLDWPRLGWQVLLQTVLCLPLAVAFAFEHPTPMLAGEGAWLWPLWIAGSAYALACLRAPPQRLAAVAHVSVLATLTLVLGIDLARRAIDARLGDAWSFTLALLPLQLLSLGLWRTPQRCAWPLASGFPNYAHVWHGLAASVLGVGWVLALAYPADAAPLPYLPLANPLEALQWGLLWMAWRALGGPSLPLRAALAGAGLLLLTLALLRVLHHHAGLPWSPRMFDSALTQGALSVLWALAGVYAWVRGSRSGQWSLWLGGAVLMGGVLLKLLAIDRSYLGNLAGIAAVLTVGLLLVIVGYLAPSPPRRSGESP